MQKQVIFFIIAFLAPLAFYRLAWYVLPFIFKRPFTRTVMKVRVHHLHYGMIYTLIGAILFLLNVNPLLISVLLGLGLGLMFDLFVSSLFVETDRKQELVVYRESLVPTLVVFALITGLILILVAIVGRT